MASKLFKYLRENLKEQVVIELDFEVYVQFWKVE
jgi:hypothetical protein